MVVPVLLLAVAGAVGGIVWFRHQADQVHAQTAAQTANAQAPVDPVAQALATDDSVAPAGRDRQEITMHDPQGRWATVASREVDDHVFHHTIVAHLPDPPDGYYYACWLLRDIPYDYFSTGSMVRNADGTYALIWDGPLGKDFIDYNHVIITLEQTGGDPGPNGHVMEGSF